MNEVRTYRQQWIVKAIIVIIGIMLTWPALTAHAEEKRAGIDLQSAVGYQGSFKDGHWYPVKLTLTNDTGKDMSGDLVLSYLNGNNGTTDAIVPLELPQGSPVQVTIGVPGVVLNKDSNRIMFFQDGYRGKESKQVTLGGRGYLDARNTLSYMIGVVSRDPDTFNFMPRLNQRGYDIAVYPMQPHDLPEEAHLLDSFDTLVINDMATADWSAARVQAIKDWVVRGGTLVLAGGAGYTQTAAAFTDIAPVEAQGTTTIASAVAIAAAGGEDLPLPQGLTVSTIAALQGTAVIVEGDTPLAVTTEHGFGQVIYAAFDPSLEPMASWSGSAMLWAKLLGSSLSPLQQANGGMGYSVYMNAYWQLNNLLDLFPSIKQPELTLLIAMFGLYILVIAPILYVVLAKADRREWAWWLIPALSVAMGMTVFLIGAGDKRSVMAHTIEIIELSSDEKTVISGGTGIFTPTGGTVTAAFDEVIPLRMYGDNNGMNSGLNTNGHYQLRSGSDETKSIWRSVPYWSTRKLWFDRRVAASEETGTLNVSYEEHNGKTRMVVINDTTADLSDVYYLGQGAAARIGDLKQGERGELIPPSSSSTGYSYYNYGGAIFPYPSNGRQSDEHRRQRELIDIYYSRYNGSIASAEPLIVGFSMDKESQYLVNGESVKSDNLKMWVKELPVADQAGGRVVVPAGAISPIITSNTLQSYSSHGDGAMQVGAGELELEYMVPNGYGVAYDKLDVQFPNGKGDPNAVWRIWRESTGEWTELTETLEEPASYLTAVHSIRIKLTSSTENMIWLPQPAMEGEVLQR